MYLLEDDTHWESTLYEGVLCCSAKSLRFVCQVCQVTDPHILRQNYRESMAEDILQSRRPELSSNNLDFNQNTYDEA